MTKILDGKKAASEIKEEIKEEVDSYLYAKKTPPCLAVVLCTNDSASKIYVKKKQQACEECGITSFLIEPFEGGIEKWHNPKKHLLSTVEYLNKNSSINGILVQLPLPDFISAHEVFDKIDHLKDVDVFSPTNVGLLSQGRPRLVPCTPQGVQELLIRNNIEIKGKKVAVINRSDIVGKPLSSLLVQDDGTKANATVFMCHDNTSPEHLKEVCLNSDIIVVAVGKIDFLTPDMVREGSIVIDVGINRIPETGKITGDVHHDVYPKTYAYSPVPGGCGPMTVACLMKNVLKAYKLQMRMKMPIKVSKICDQ
jgi:methylenetetrahydrofolate dehydrogenase (NADP+)/methenyltetrahydrofolate cyclohydrolase